MAPGVVSREVIVLLRKTPLAQQEGSDFQPTESDGSHLMGIGRAKSRRISDFWGQVGVMLSFSEHKGHIRPIPEDEVNQGKDKKQLPWVRKYLDLADRLMKRDKPEQGSDKQKSPRAA